MFTADDLNKLLGFIGYGRLDAPIWFIGMEEAGGGEQNLRTRLQFKPVMDLARAQGMLGYGAYFDLPDPQIQPTWQVLIQITLGILSLPSTPEDIGMYQALQLGSAEGDTLLAELMPLPAPTMGHWAYQSLFTDQRLSSPELYLKTIKPLRIKMLQDLITRHQPRLVICYGRSNWADYQRLFLGTNFRQTDLSAESGDRTPAGVDQIADGRTPFGGLAFLIAHPLAQGMNAHWRLEAIVRLIRSAIQHEAQNP